MKIAIVGTGGIGGYFGGKIAKSGHDIIFVARGEHFKAIQEKGLKVNSIGGNFSIEKAQITNNLKDIKEAELIILGVKAWQIKDIAQELKDIVKSNTTIMPLQNGVMATHELINVLDKKYVIGGLCRIISKIESPGVINHFGVEPFIAFGELNNQKTERIIKIKELFDHSGINSIIADDINIELWKKFMAICVSGLLAVARSTYGAVRELKETRLMMFDLLCEIYNVALKSGINLDRNVIENTMQLIDSYPYDSTSSLTRDVMEGRPSEIEYQNGTVVKLGEKYNVKVPVNRYVYNCILPMELAARKNLK